MVVVAQPKFVEHNNSLLRSWYGTMGSVRSIFTFLVALSCWILIQSIPPQGKQVWQGDVNLQKSKSKKKSPNAFVMNGDQKVLL
jgi:hypothetical protein